MDPGGEFSDGRRGARSGVRQGQVSDGQQAGFQWSERRSGEQTAQEHRRNRTDGLAKAGLLNMALLTAGVSLLWGSPCVVECLAASLTSIH